MADVCTWCLMAMTSPSTYVQLHLVGSDDTEAFFDASRDIQTAPLARRAEILRQAQEAGWNVQIDAMRVGPPITTWHSDPICEFHLYDVAKREREPATVRMAQWGPRRA
jgi:hypothetical protein